MRPPSGRGVRGFAPSSAAGGRGSPRFEGQGRGRGRGGHFRDEGPPTSVEAIGTFLHACEGEIVCRSTHKKVPYFNATIYLENKTQVGKVEEIFGPVNNTMFTVKLLEGINAISYEKGAIFYISPDKLLPVERFTSPQTRYASGFRYNFILRNRSASKLRGRGAGRGASGRAVGGRLSGRGGRAGRGQAGARGRGGRGGRSRF